MILALSQVSNDDPRFLSYGPNDAKGMPGYAVRLTKKYTDPVTGRKFFPGCLQPLNPQDTVEEIGKRHPLPSEYKAVNDRVTIGELRKATGQVGINKIAAVLHKKPELTQEVNRRHKRHPHINLVA